MGRAALTSLLLTLPGVVFLGLTSAQPIEVKAKSGETACLPCPVASNIKVVEWSRPDLDPECVLLYQDKQFDQHSQNPSFKNRTQLEIKDGNLTLILHDVKINDTGTYECRVLANRRKRGVDPIHIIHLSVDPPGQPGGLTEDGGKEDGGKEDGSVGLTGGHGRGHFPLIASLSFICVVCILTTVKYFCRTRDKATDTQVA
ncbi:V-set and immunoglobulin domain-containing protein 1-like [Astatotilapia calliptera]|uniref:V-set and immunoglobulin domain-containing protein 1-like n=1 Tax=Astatotilapia calliptera TaxID=8154 RepID=UPI000E3FF607|nr:V-set and immunoglobulin domain-containing protein 1-like [Astatotilapia calliptera]